MLDLSAFTKFEVKFSSPTQRSLTRILLPSLIRLSVDNDFVVLEISDPPRWDPRNRETADHSMPYNVARGLIEGDVYIDSFTKEKYMDPKARES